MSGAYPQGSLLPSVDEMCARFSVSRTAIREAYSFLGSKSLIVAKPKVGTRVRPATEWNLIDPEVLAWHVQSGPTEGFVTDLFVLRQAIEPTAAALAATRRSKEALAKIAIAFADMTARGDGAGDLIEADLRFHMGILDAAGNHFFAALGGLIHTSLQCAFGFSWAGAERIQRDRLRQHEAILRAIELGSPEDARARMGELLRDSLEDIREYLDKGERKPEPSAAQSPGRRASPPSGPSTESRRRAATRQSSTGAKR
ncbi:MAG: FadR family transcriptional regulator [Hyphomicrobiales bacterium]|nr:FadR family transcriptional regulator [Hyphomicrobiales bacterium]